MNMMHYKGYTAKVWYSEEDGCFVGRVMGITDIVSFDGESVKQLETAFHEMIDHYIEASQRLGVPPQKPYSGRATSQRTCTRRHGGGSRRKELQSVGQ